MAVTYRCLIVDDEPLARRVIARHIAALPWLELAAECGSARAAAAYLHEHPVDVIFLDIKMPGLSGLDLLQTLPDPPQVILTTAYSEYALAGYEYSVVDYLLKPVSLERFLKAVNKLTPPRRIPAAQRDTIPPANDFIFLRADRVDYKVRFDEIRYLEGYGNFIRVHLDRGRILVAKTLAAMEQILPRNRFLRVHRSFIVALGRIDRIAPSALRIGKADIPIGRTYRREVSKAVGRRG
jgi:DNA-binding LytR/AlgR family response regulator